MSRHSTGYSITSLAVAISEMAKPSALMVLRLIGARRLDIVLEGEALFQTLDDGCSAFYELRSRDSFVHPDISI
jgi:hypothetical protein